MTPRTILITSAHARYFELVKGCIQSVRDKPQGRQIPFALLDVGCTEEQRDWLRSRVDFLQEPAWEFDFPTRAEKPAYFRGLLARPFLRRYFPDFEVYLWLDADAWVQEWYALELLCQGSFRRRGLAIVPEIDRGSARQYGGLPGYWRQARGWYAAAFGDEVANSLYSFPMLNAGVFALHRDAPHWQHWEQSIARAVRSHCTVMTDQLALNYAVYRLAGLFAYTELLPAWCNWACHNAFPQWDEGRHCLVEPFLPHTPIGVMHLTTRDKNPIHRLATTAGGAVDVRITYPTAPANAAQLDQDSA